MEEGTLEVVEEKDEQKNLTTSWWSNMAIRKTTNWNSNSAEFVTVSMHGKNPPPQKSERPR